MHGDRHAQRVTLRTTDRRVDDALGVLQVTPDERRVDPGDRVRGQLVHQLVVGLRGPGPDQQPRRAPVQPVHQAGAELLPHAGQLRIPGEQAVHHRRTAVTGTGVHDHARGLVHDQELVVDRQDRHLHRRVGLDALHRSLGPSEQRQDLIGVHAQRRLADDLAVDEHVAGADQRGRLGA